MIEDEKAHQFLMGLNDEVYLSIRSQLLALEPLLSLDKIFNMISQEKAYKNIMIARDDRQGATTAFAVKHTTRALSITERPTCKHCGKMGDDEAKCFEVIGYPAGWGARAENTVVAADLEDEHRMEEDVVSQPKL